MADDTTPDAPRDRATVALVSEQVRGVERLVERGFIDVQRQLDRVAALPATVAALSEQYRALDERVDDLEKAFGADRTERTAAQERFRDWKRGAIFTAALALVGVFVNLTITFHWIT